MKQLLIAMAMLCATAMAQTSSGTTGDQSSAQGTSAAPQASTSSTGQEETAKPQSDQSAKEKAAAKDKSLKGCLHKEGDNYWLKTRTSRYHVMSSEDLSAHDGHEVKITGKVEKAAMPGSTDKKKVNHLEASSVEMVSDKCAMGTKSMKMKGHEMSKDDTTKK